MKKSILITLISVFLGSANAQDMHYARNIIDTLTSDFFWGRGYTKNGMQKTADFLMHELNSLGVQALNGKSYFQKYSYSVNTFPGKMELSINGKQLVPGRDFIVAPESIGIKTRDYLLQQDSSHFKGKGKPVSVVIEDKLTWSVSQKTADYTAFHVKRSSLVVPPYKLKVNIENVYNKSFETTNVCGIIKGNEHPDSLILITAHYDHLGGMGNRVFFPGANDNASGVSLLLSLAKYYTQNPPPYSIAFICFSGEEAGLLGSRYFSEHPLVALDKIRFLINLDLTGTGEKGITVVNATVFEKEFTLLKEINHTENHVVKIEQRGKAANSDHYWFTQKNVPSFFIYTLGGIKAYHDIYDRSSTLPLTAFSDLFKLIINFNNKLMH